MSANEVAINPSSVSAKDDGVPEGSASDHLREAAENKREVLTLTVLRLDNALFSRKVNE